MVLDLTIELLQNLKNAMDLVLFQVLSIHAQHKPGTLTDSGVYIVLKRHVEERSKYFQGNTSVLE
eukprot:6327060-Amphidinium_carterae.1